MSVGKNLRGAGELSGRKRRFAAPSAIAIALGLAALGVTAPRPVYAVDDQQLQLLQDQIRQLQAQIDALKKTQTQQAQDQTVGGPQAGNRQAKVYVTGPAYMYGPYRAGGNEFGLSTADGQNTIELTGRLQFDAASYLGYERNAGLASPSKLESGVNGRRIRLGIVGQFAGDFQYGLIADFGGSSDSISPYVSGAATSEIENAFISYSGFNKPENMVPVSIDVGYIDAPIQLNEAMSSNDRLMLEAPTPEVIATEFGGGDNRSVFGARSYKSNYYAAAYVSGPTAGTPHNYAVSSDTSTSVESEVTSGEALAFLGRLTYQPYTDDISNIHVGVNGSYMVNPGATTTTASGIPAFGRSITLSDRPELRIDPTSLLSTGSIGNVADGGYIGGEFAGQYDHFFAQSEIYDYFIDRRSQVATAAAPLPSLNFYGGYLEGSWTIGGKRNYFPGAGAYTGVAPDAPLNMKAGTWGAIEFAGRFSYTDLNDHVSSGETLGTSGGVAGGEQTTASLAVNYYPYSNVKLMLEYDHTDVAKNTYAAGAAPTPAGAVINAVAARFQVAW